MEVKFIKCASTKLSSVPVVDGQVIVLTDSSMIYYDMGNARRTASPISLSDNYTTSAGSASAGVGASSKAVSDCYAAAINKMSYFMPQPYFISTLAQLDASVGSGAAFSWAYGLIDNIGYWSIHIGWITLQFKVDTWSVQKRIKYGNNVWTSWS